jgi:hypothetical protein
MIPHLTDVVIVYQREIPSGETTLSDDPNKPRIIEHFESTEVPGLPQRNLTRAGLREGWSPEFPTFRRIEKSSRERKVAEGAMR